MCWHQQLTMTWPPPTKKQIGSITSQDSSQKVSRNSSSHSADCRLVGQEWAGGAVRGVRQGS